MQLPPSDEIVMVSGLHPICARKARYFDDVRFQERILPPPLLTHDTRAHPDDWSGRALPLRPSHTVTPEEDEGEAEDPKYADRRQQPELTQKALATREPDDNEFVPDFIEDLDEDAPRARRMNDLMKGVARQASLDPNDDLGL